MQLDGHAAFFSSYYHEAQMPSSDAENRILVYQREAWSTVNAASIPAKKLEGIYKSTLQKVASLNLESIPKAQILLWIERFNAAMTLSALKDKKIKAIDKKHVGQVKFSSTTKFAWLSNFFPTVIYDNKHKMIYPSVESGYVAFKARKANAAGSDVDVEMYAHEIDPKIVKRMGQKLWERQSEADNEEAIAEMERLVTLKFQQNPVIAIWLRGSQAELEEFTSDCFWGVGHGGYRNENSNQLGRIIQRVRETLKTL